MQYILVAVVVAMGLWAAWLSGRDVERRNAARRAEERCRTDDNAENRTKGAPDDGRKKDEV